MRHHVTGCSFVSAISRDIIIGIQNRRDTSRPILKQANATAPPPFITINPSVVDTRESLQAPQGFHTCTRPGSSSLHRPYYHKVGRRRAIHMRRIWRRPIRIPTPHQCYLRIRLQMRTPLSTLLLRKTFVTMHARIFSRSFVIWMCCENFVAVWALLAFAVFDAIADEGDDTIDRSEDRSIICTGGRGDIEEEKTEQDGEGLTGESVTVRHRDGVRGVKRI
jgi:hypothetical protein